MLRKKIIGILSVVVIMLMFTVATNVGAQCIDANTGKPLPPGWCFYHNGWMVTIQPDGQGNFPKFDLSGNSVFEYSVVNIGGKSMSKVDILVPICNRTDLTDPDNLEIITNSPSGTFYGPPKYPVGWGDPNTGFGLGLITSNTFVWDGSAGIISLTLKGKVNASPNAMLLNRGTANYAYGQILSPACNLIPAEAYEWSPGVPFVSTTDMTIGELQVCLESDQSGCPANIFACTDPTYWVCDCPAVSREPWTKGNIRDLKLTPGQLRQAWTDHNNPRCSLTFMSLNENSCGINMITQAGDPYKSGVLAAIDGYVYAANGTAVSNVRVIVKNSNGTSFNKQPMDTTNALGYYKICLPVRLNSTIPWTGTVTISSAYSPTNCGGGSVSGDNCNYVNINTDRSANFKAK